MLNRSIRGSERGSNKDISEQELAKSIVEDIQTLSETTGMGRG